MKRISEVHVMTLLILFAVFAFVMQAHGEGGLGNGIIPIRHLSPTTETDEFYTVQRAKDGLYEVTWDEGDRYIPVKSKTLAEDMAYALNRAHEERTRKVDGITLTPIGRTISVDPFTFYDFYDCKDGVKATPCTEEKPR